MTPGENARRTTSETPIGHVSEVSSPSGVTLTAKPPPLSQQPTETTRARLPAGTARQMIRIVRTILIFVVSCIVIAVYLLVAEDNDYPGLESVHSLHADMNSIQRAPPPLDPLRMNATMTAIQSEPTGENVGHHDSGNGNGSSNNSIAVGSGNDWNASNSTIPTPPSSSSSPMRILYLMTSSSKKIKKRRKGMDHFVGDDRFGQVVMPVLLDSIESMVSYGHSVDFFLVADFNLTADEDASIRESLPPAVGFDSWQDACPLDYDNFKFQKLDKLTRSLARQHRFVVKDKLFDYDFFVCYEDDMPVYGHQIEYYLEMSRTIQKWRDEAPEELPAGVDPKGYTGPLTKEQILRVRPGFIRAEVLLDPENVPTQRQLHPIGQDYYFPDYDGYDNETQYHLNASVCCGSKRIHGLDGGRTPGSTDLMIWETNILGISYRQMPDGQWYGLMAGPKLNEEGLPIAKIHPHQVTNKLPRTLQTDPKLLAQSAGWMMTRKQILELHLDACAGSFLPPFDSPMKSDGLYSHNVEFWSGGIQMWCARDGCNIQRILALDPKRFAHHLSYHSANNKQKSVVNERLVNADIFLGQLNTMRKFARRKVEKEVK